jgi:hypothetical protein
MKTLTINGRTYTVTPVVPTDSVTLLASAWVGDEHEYSQVVELSGVTPHTKVDLQPTSKQLVEFHDKVLGFVAENDGGLVTVFAIGDKPSNDHTIQVTMTEVEATGKIRGNTVGTTMPRSDWSQTDPTKADYIKNKPTGLGGTADDSGQNVALTTAQINALDGMFRVCAYDDSKDVSGAYAAFKSAFGIADEPGEEEPDAPVIPEKTLTSISAVYSGGDVAVGTAVADLTGVVVTAHYSDGTSATVTHYTLSGIIALGSNAVTVSYGGKTTTFTVTGVAESGDTTEEIPADATRLAYIESTGTQYIDTGIKPAFTDSADITYDADENIGSVSTVFGAYDGATTALLRYYANATYAKIGWISNQANINNTSVLGEPLNLQITHNASYADNSYWVWSNDFSSSTKSTTPEAVSGVNLFLFAHNNNGTASNFASCKIREFTISNDAGERIHLVPVKDADGVVCMYDTVGKRYLYNAGTGDFVGGDA